MAIVGALSIGRSGLVTSGAALSVIGNNIANVQTVGFKGSRTEFSDLISADIGAQAGKVGLGSRIGEIRTLFAQGPIESTGRPLDLALDGLGFFVLRSDQGQVYTRAGNFQLTADGTVTNLLGDVLQGTPVDTAGNAVGGLQDVSIANIGLQPTPTANLGLNGNLRSDAATAPAFDGTSLQTAYNTSSYGTSVQVYDSLGKSHELTLFFSKTANPREWTVRAAVDAGETGGAAGTPQVVGTSTVTFDTSGALPASTTLAAAVTFSGAAAQNLALDLSSMTQLAADSALGSVTQDGFGVGGLASVGVDERGIVNAIFDNGQSRPLFQLAVATFNAPEGLAAAGNGVYRQTVESGEPALGVAAAGGNGQVVSSALEQSNVELAQQFIDLISTQRSFQANARIISTSDALLNDLINVVR